MAFHVLRVSLSNFFSTKKYNGSMVEVVGFIGQEAYFFEDFRRFIGSHLRSR